MDIYHIWGDLKEGAGDLEFAANLNRYLADLKERGQISGWRLARLRALRIHRRSRP